MTNEERDQLIVAWQGAKAVAVKATATEVQLRQQIAAELFPDAAPECTTNLELGMGYKLKLVRKRNYNLAKNDEVTKALDAIAKVDNEGAFIAERLVGWTPKLSLTEYRDLNPKYRQHIDAVLAVSDGMPTLEVVEPKAK